MPVPETVRTVEDVLLRIMGRDELPTKAIDEACTFWRSLSVPEARPARAIRRSRTRSLDVQDVFTDGEPLFDVEAVAAGVPLRIRLEPAGRVVPCELSFPIRWLNAVVVGPAVPPRRIVAAALRRLAAVPIPSRDDGERPAHEGSRSVRAVETAWRVFRTRIWLGQEFAADWRTRRLTLLADHLRLDLRSSRGRLVVLALFPACAGDVGPREGGRLVARSDLLAVYDVGSTMRVGRQVPAPSVERLYSRVRDLVRRAGRNPPGDSRVAGLG
jgi:hypothetical protein